MALSQDLASRARALHELLKRDRALADNAEDQQAEIENQRAETEKWLGRTTFADFLYLCHTNVFMQLKVQENRTPATTGGPEFVDGKCYPRRLQPWTKFDALYEENFSRLEEAFQGQQLFSSPAGLEYFATKVAEQKLASEEDVKNFECLAVEGCVLDIAPRFFELVGSDAAASSSVDMGSDTISTLKTITFNSHPFGVMATDADEEETESEVESQQHGGPSHQTPGGRPLERPLGIKDDRPANMGAPGVAENDVDAAAARVVAEAKERERSETLKKRVTPKRKKLHPNQWCFRHSTDDTLRPLFVVEYTAPHKIDGGLLRSSLMPEEAGTLMEDGIRMAARQRLAVNYAKLDVAKTITQVFHYMVDYGLQYSYATTGEALVFFYLDPDQPSTLYYHLEEPKLAVQSAEREAIKHSAVALVATFVLMSTSGQYMTQRWKQAVRCKLPKWPVPYADMSIWFEYSSSDSSGDTSPTPVKLTPPPRRKAAGGPQKPNSRRRRYHEDDSDRDDPTFKPGRSTKVPATPGKRPLRRTTRTSSRKSASDAASTQDGPRQSVWAVPANAVPSPALAYCTQACLLGLAVGGKKDPSCPNAHLHRRRSVADERHPISAEELRERLVQQLAEDMDHDCQSLEQHGLFGATGALFKVALSEFGYCLVGKGVQRAHRRRLEREAAAYGLLAGCQGRLVPVSLGVIRLRDEYWTACGAHVAHMMLMSFGGRPLWCHGRPTGHYYLYHREMLRTLEEAGPYGALHGDESRNSMAWNEELQRVMLIDFDHAAVLRQQPPDKRAAPGDGDGSARRRKRAKALREEETPA